MTVEDEQDAERVVEPNVTDEEAQANDVDVEEDVEAHVWRAQS
jgi:hypothetical protein